MPNPLTTRQLEVLLLLAEGHSNKIIAYKLNIAEATVKVHVRVILGKVNAKNRIGAVLWAAQSGVVTLAAAA